MQPSYYVVVEPQIIRYDPDTGRCLSYVDLPVRIVTSCCWAGASYDELIVTSERCVLLKKTSFGYKVA